MKKSTLKVGDTVVHDFSRYIGKVLEIRDDKDGYNYLVYWTTPLGYNNTDWYRSEVLEKRND